MPGNVRIADGKMAVWTGADDLAPFNNPLGNISRVKFHSDFDYVRVVKTLLKSVTLPAIGVAGSGQSDPGVRVASYNLGAHGEGRTPFIVGYITVSGTPVAFTGSVLVHTTPAQNSTSPRDNYGRWLALGYDATNIYIHEYAIQAGDKSTGVWESRPAQTFSITLGITDESL